MDLESNPKSSQLPTLYSQVEKKIVVVRQIPVILDADVASLYGVETKRVNEAIKNNPDKFPEDYMFVLTNEDLQDLRSKFLTANISSKSRKIKRSKTTKCAVSEKFFPIL